MVPVIKPELLPPVFCPQVDAMKTGAKEMKKAYKDVKIDQIDVRLLFIWMDGCISTLQRWTKHVMCLFWVMYTGEQELRFPSLYILILLLLRHTACIYLFICLMNATSGLRDKP